MSPVVKKSSSNKIRAYGGAVGAVCATAMVALAVANGGSASSFTGGDVTAAGRGVLPRRMAMLGKGGSAASSSLKAEVDASVETKTKSSRKKSSSSKLAKSENDDKKKDTSILESAKSMLSSFMHSPPVEALEEKGEGLKKEVEEKAAETLTSDLESKKHHQQHF